MTTDYDEVVDERMDAERCLSRSQRFVRDKIARLRLGVYDETLDGTLLETLEEIERILGNG